jgi:hypothetical protein
MSVPETPIDNTRVKLTKEDQSLVFSAWKPDGAPFTEGDYQESRRKADVNRARAPSLYRICAEGDSWINILWPLSRFEGYNETFVDIIERDARFSISNIGWPGDTFESIVQREQFKAPIQSGIFDLFILCPVAGMIFSVAAALQNSLSRFTRYRVWLVRRIV